MTDKLLVYHCFGNHELTRPMSIDIEAVIICPDCGKQMFLLGSRAVVEADDTPTQVQRPPWYRDPSLCPLCGGKGEIGGVICACRMERP